MFIDLTGTALEARAFEPVSWTRSEQEWLDCQVAGARFEGAGGALQLRDVLRTFLDWAARAPTDRGRAEPG